MAAFVVVAAVVGSCLVCMMVLVYLADSDLISACKLVVVVAAAACLDCSLSLVEEVAVLVKALRLMACKYFVVVVVAGSFLGNIKKTAAVRLYSFLECKLVAVD